MAERSLRQREIVGALIIAIRLLGDRYEQVVNESVRVAVEAGFKLGFHGKDWVERNRRGGLCKRE